MTAPTAVSGAEAGDRAWVDAAVEAHRGELVALRRHLHAHPEPSGAEVETTELILERLAAAGLDPQVLPSGTGLVCDVGGGDGPARVALRADIDALAMADLKDVPYRSRVEGMAHACGHDVHTAVVLGTGLVLADRLTTERVRLVFEPAEEAVPGGAVEVLSSGALEGVERIFGLHCDPKLDVGSVGVRRGAITAAADRLDVVLSGPGGHTARPHLTVDLVDAAARVVRELPERVTAAAGGEVLVVFGSVAAGDAPNVIPTSALIRGSLRTPDRDVWDRAEPLVVESVAGILGDTGATWEVRYTRGVPPVVNHPAETDLLAAAARRAVGPAGVVETPRSTGGDSFAWYLERLAGSYARLGTHRPGGGERLDLHAGSFDVDERAIDVGVAVLVHTALDALALGRA
jgi:amidohydrolase